MNFLKVLVSMDLFALSKPKFLFLLCISFAIVAFGQPAWFPWLGLISAFMGYALFWRAMLSLPIRKQRFWVSLIWFSSIQMIQLSWFLSHPFSYIYLVWLFLSFGAGLQFGLLSLLFHPLKMVHFSRILAIASCWTILEWSRLFLLSGSAFNPIGLALAGNIISLQLASLIGVFGLSFMVILLNLLALRMWIYRFHFRSLIPFISGSAFLFLYGGLHYSYHSAKMDNLTKSPEGFFNAILVQTAFPVEETIGLQDRNQFFAYVMGEWKKILSLLSPHQGRSADLIALPELVVPFGTYTFLYPFEEVRNAFQKDYGDEVESKFPALELPFAYETDHEKGKTWMVSNAFWAQTLANIFNAGLVIGLEDAEDVQGEREYYSAALYFIPESKKQTQDYLPQRYSKRVLVPMGEYIPFSFCRTLAAKYGVFGSFTHGKEPVVWKCNGVDFGLSICYEEMYGNLMRENRQRGANFLLNITSDAWFPNSKLIRQHLEHSRLRTVENGFPLARSCNTGITCSIDALGRDVDLLGENDRTREGLSDALWTSFPKYHYSTVYSRWGDGLIVLVSVLSLLAFFRYPNSP